MSFLIRNCQLLNRQLPADVRLRGASIDAIGYGLLATPEETAIDAQGGLLLPGLHDHHIHLLSLAASLASVQCGPPTINTEEELADLLQRENRSSNAGWLRGIGYHPSVAGDIDRYWLDNNIANRPIRIQHRGGRQWILNSCALETLGLLEKPPRYELPRGIEYHGDQPTGRLLDCDQWLRAQLRNYMPDLESVSEKLASYGITGITDATPSNGQTEWNFFKEAQTNGSLKQKVRMMGSQHLRSGTSPLKLQVGEYKIHLLETQLPSFDSMRENIQQAHKADRGVAIHCVTHTELVFALSCLESAGVKAGDRIEHASVTCPEMLEQIACLGMRVVSQPHFVLERGDQYLSEVDRQEHNWLYRLRSFIDAGVPLAGGSDAAFGSANPWVSMQAAVNRRTLGGSLLGEMEALTPDMALRLYTSDAQHPGVTHRTLSTGSEASLCLLSAPWETVQNHLDRAEVRATWLNGELIFQKA